MPGIAEDGNKPSTAFAGVEESVMQADSCIKRGEYRNALESYRAVSRQAPGDSRILQRIAELKGFLNMTGRGDDVLIEILERFLKALKRNLSESG